MSTNQIRSSASRVAGNRRGRRLSAAGRARDRLIPSSLPAWLTDAERSRLDRFRQRVRALLGPRLLKFCLFGSRARGEGHAESDLDVLLVLREKTDEQRDGISAIEDEIFQADGYPLQGQISPLIMSEADWLFTLDRELLIGREITEQGIPL